MADDYIKRENVLSFINDQHPDDWFHYPSWYADHVKRIPAEDVRPVVLCKGCDRWNRWDRMETLEGFWCSCAYWSGYGAKYYTVSNEFCSNGVPYTGGDDCDE